MNTDDKHRVKAADELRRRREMYLAPDSPPMCCLGIEIEQQDVKRNGNADSIPDGSGFSGN